MAAQQYFIDVGSEMKVEKLTAQLPAYIPAFVLNASNKANNQERWIQLILHAFRKVSSGSAYRGEKYRKKGPFR